MTNYFRGIELISADPKDLDKLSRPNCILLYCQSMLAQDKKVKIREERGSV
jgi:hypothetical protein